MSNIKSFQHKFSNGTIIKLDFDFAANQPYCESNLRMDIQPPEIREEFRVWVDEVVIPVVFEVLTPKQVLNFVKFGFQNLEVKKTN